MNQVFVFQSKRYESRKEQEVGRPTFVERSGRTRTTFLSLPLPLPSDPLRGGGGGTGWSEEVTTTFHPSPKIRTLPDGRRER